MPRDGTIIYVAGNPNCYPLEYYDAQSQTYRGAIADFLGAFAQEYGYDLRYLSPGAEDRRESFAENQQVDLISGCDSQSRYAHTSGDPLVLFFTEAQGETSACQLWLTEVAPDMLRSDLSEYAARTSQAEWTGAVLKALDSTAPRTVPPGAIWAGTGLILLLVAGLTAAVLRLRRVKRRAGLARKTDARTGLENEEGLRQAFARIAGDQSRAFYSVVWVHLNLDRVGELWGQDQAQALLLHGAQVMREAAETPDTLAAVGQDLLALKRAPAGEAALRWAEGVVARIRAGFDNPLGAQDVAAGVFPLETEFLDCEHAMFHARQSALRAARLETGCLLCEAQQLHTERERRRLLSDFRQGIARQEFQFYLQFFVDAGKFRVIGGEALSRWNHPRMGLLNPGRYIPLLEESGCIGTLDFYGLEQTCAFLEELERRQIRDFFISCNFSRKTFCAPDFVRRCIQTVERHSFSRKLLILEITESQRLGEEEVRQMLQNILDVRKSGLRVIFDDFGVGFSSFDDLQDYPMDGLKLDKRLVDNVHTERGKIILNVLVEASHRMGLTILAEGVEKDEQIEALRRVHCDALQGFRFCVPLPEAEALRRIVEELRVPQRRGTEEKDG